MKQHKVFIRSVHLPSGEIVALSYWGTGASISVAGFINNKQVTESYSGEAEIADDFSSTFHQSLISGLADSLESDLRNNPNLHLRS